MLTQENNVSSLAHVFAGTKSDLRIPGSDKFVTTQEGKKLRSKIGAYSLVECSAKKKQNLALVFEEAVRAVERKPQGGGKVFNCSIL
jgi:Ras-related C3 botulinum toxin substrate 1